MLKDAKKLKNKVVLITGSGDLDGFGGKLALEAAHYGAKVVVSDSNEEGVDAVVEEIQKRGGCVVFLSYSSFFLLRTNSLLDTELLPASLAISLTTSNS